VSTIPPFAGLTKIGKMKDGSPIFGPRYAAHHDGAAASLLPPRWKYVGGLSPGMAYGELVRRGQDFRHDGWPTDPDCEPENPAAHQVAEYYAKHRGNPHLPSSAWNTERGCLNRIPAEQEQLSAKPELQPRLRTREKS
jgi:hypothetical protein